LFATLWGIEPESPGSQNTQLLKKEPLLINKRKRAIHKIYCLPGKSSFYDVIPLRPAYVNETADFILQNLLKF
jgi:hypothetical protein